jgi:osmotically-inducible protein OsmY
MRWQAWLLILGTLSSAFGQAPAPISGTERLQNAVMQALLLDPDLGGYPLTAVVGPSSKITLNGVLPSAEERSQAEKLAQAVPGAGKVSDHIMVDKAASRRGDATAADPSRLANLQSRVQQALDSHLALTGITARAYPHLVALTGIAATAADRALAAQLAQENAGGVKVANAIAVSPANAPVL